ncbi:condensation domain-containing protein, partial [Nocardia sp. R7R-8]|uniref:condensation domain-containing protein n=1 Tax=Nocardia sp. R7R-8 TaxID=3459304 RepID=UPI00403E2F71
MATYNMPVAFRLRGAVDAEALMAAIDDVVGRHESLRTVFIEVDGAVEQQVLAPASWFRGKPVEMIDEAGLPARLAEFARHVFDLSIEIPLRAELFAVDGGEYVLALVMHHIASDGWSLAPLARDVLTAYQARRHGGEPQWQPLPVQYIDYTLWQREILGEESDPDSVIAQQLSYWSGELRGLPDVLALPADRPRPPVASYVGGRVEVIISPETWAAIKQLGLRSQATPSMVLQSVLVVLLHRICGERDIAIGAPIAGRMDDALDDLVGFFVNTWVLRVPITEDREFGDILEIVREKALGAYSHQDVPFERLVEWINPTRSTAYHPLFQVALAFHNNVRAEVDLDGVTVDTIGLSTDTAKFDLDFDLEEAVEGDTGQAMVTGAVSYATDLFDHATVQRMVTWYHRILEAVVVDSSVVVGDIDLMDAA